MLIIHSQDLVKI